MTTFITISQNYASDGSGETTTGTTSFYADPFADARGKWHSTSHVPDPGRNSTVYRVSCYSVAGPTGFDPEMNHDLVLEIPKVVRLEKPQGNCYFLRWA